MISTKDDFTKAFLECTKNEGYIDLPQEILDGRLDFLFVMNELTNYKLTVSQLNKLYIILAGLLLGKYPKIAFEVQQSDRIRLPYAAIDLLPATKGKLTSQEKLLFAFCTFYSVCVEVYDEKKDKIYRGIRDIDSPAHAMRLLEWERENHPEKFAFLLPKEHVSEKTFAVSKDNPVKAVSIADSYTYLRSIRTRDGKPIHYKRAGSMMGKHGGIIDGYTLYFDGKELNIYIDPYAEENSTEAPEGLVLARSHSVDWGDIWTYNENS